MDMDQNQIKNISVIYNILLTQLNLHATIPTSSEVDACQTLTHYILVEHYKCNMYMDHNNYRSNIEVGAGEGVFLVYVYNLDR